MKQNYKINQHYFHENTNFILLSNYHNLNQVDHCIYMKKPSKINKNDIGVWKIKRKK